MISVLLVLMSLAPPWLSASPASGETGQVVAHVLPTGVALPYPQTRMFRGFEYCRGRGRHHHEAIDLGGVGPLAGLGTAVRSMGPGRVTRIGKAALEPELFGVPDTRRGEAKRGGRMLPRVGRVEGYGEVAYFTKRRGKWRSGNIVEVVGTAGVLAGHRVRYMHLGAVRPDLDVGDEVAAGEELGLLGGTGVQKSSPHVHIDVVDAEGMAVDVAPLLGLPVTAKCGVVAERARALAALQDAADPRWRVGVWAPPVGAAPESVADDGGGATSGAPEGRARGALGARGWP